MLFKLNSNTPPVASLLVLEKLKNAIQVDVEWAKGNLLQPSKVRIVLSGWLCYILRCAVPGQINHAHWTTKEKCKVIHPGRVPPIPLPFYSSFGTVIRT